MIVRVIRLLARFPNLIGRRVITTVLYVIDLTVFIAQAMRDWRARSSLFDSAIRHSLVTQVIFAGIDAVPSVTVLALAAGVSITVQLIFIVQVFGTQSDVLSVLTQLVALELGSLLTASVLIGRSGSAMVVDLGNMKLNGEVEGLELLGINVNDFFVTPRLVGTAVSQLVLAVYFSSLALISGIALMAMLESTVYLNYLTEIPTAFDPLDVMFFVVKNILFGLIIGATACFHALQVDRSVTEVPQQTQQAIVNSLTMIFILDGIFVIASARASMP